MKTATNQRFLSATPDHMGTYDSYNKNAQAEIQRGEGNQKGMAYLVLGGSKFIYASAARLAVLKLLDTMNATADVLALASLEVNLNGIEPGSAITVKWRGKPVFIRRRTEAEISQAVNDDSAELRDPETDAQRVKDPEWLVLLGVCTHLGCVPINAAGDYGGWFCPCHGSHYDTSGRIRKGPAPLNLEVPEYQFSGDGKLVVG
jgi:ubiquinol-cytochrome c reductase iron-sulfur subunit